MHRVFVIGVDGGDLDLILRWKDELPTLRGFIEGGVYGKLESTMPPCTCPAWNCMFTGKNPGKIGLYDFVVSPPDKKEGFAVANYSHQDSASLWDILGQFNRRVGVVNVPTTFPPTKVNGFMVAGGLLTPFGSDLEYTFPPELKRELNEAVGSYEILPFTDLTIPGKEEEYLAAYHNNIDCQVEAVKHLIKKKEWDFLTYVFFVTDAIQHYSWHHMDEAHPRHDPERAAKYGAGIKDVYKKVDGAIADLIADMPQETNVMIVSDHGFGPLHGYFYVNRWLEERGLLKLSKDRYNLGHSLKQVLVSSKDFLSKHLSSREVQFLRRIIPAALQNKVTVRELFRSGAIHLVESMDWSMSKAFSVGAVAGIYINLQGRERDGIVKPHEYEKLREEITEMLYQTRGPKDEEVVDRVYKKEEIYRGPHLDMAPDLVFVMDGFRYVQRSGIEHDSIWREAPLTGWHRLHGTFIAYGPDIRKTGEEVQGLKIYDITPTTLHLLGCPIPQDVDGRVLTEILDEDSEVAKRPITYQGVDEKQRITRDINELKRLGRI